MTSYNPIASNRFLTAYSTFPITPLPYSYRDNKHPSHYQHIAFLIIWGGLSCTKKPIIGTRSSSYVPKNRLLVHVQCAIYWPLCRWDGI